MKEVAKLENYVYFVEASNGRIKIGTSSNIKRRFNQLQSSSPCQLKLIGVISGDKIKERQIHERFKRYNTHGEWFLGVTAIWDYIKKYVKSEE